MSKTTTPRQVLGAGEPTTSKYTRRKNYVLSEEVAREQIMDFLEYYDIDPEQGENNPLEQALQTIEDYIRRGVLEVGRDDASKIKVIHNLSSGNEALEYHEIQAKHKISVDSCKSNAGYTRIYTFMGALSGVGRAGIEKLSAKDLAVVEVLGLVFLAA